MQDPNEAQERRRRDAKRIMWIKLFVYLILIINIIKYICIDVPEKYLKEKRLDDIQIWIFMIGAILGKIADILLAGYFYYLAVPSIIFIMKHDVNVLADIREIRGLTR